MRYVTFERNDGRKFVQFDKKKNRKIIKDLNRGFWDTERLLCIPMKSEKLIHQIKTYNRDKYYNNVSWKYFFKGELK